MEILDIVAAVSPFIATLFTIWLSRRRQGVRWVTVTPISMMEIADEILDRLQVTLDGKSVSNLTKFTFIVHNFGRDPIDGKSIVEPLTWKAPGRIIDVRVVGSEPRVELKLESSKRTLEVRWELFNQGCQALIEVIVDAETETETEIENVSAQIRGIPKIHIKGIRHIDEESIRKSVRKNISQSPRLLRPLFSENLSLYFARYSKHVLAGYFAITLGVIAGGISDVVQVSSDGLSLLVGFAFGGSLYTLFAFFILRNPYSKLLRNRSMK